MFHLQIMHLFWSIRETINYWIRLIEWQWFGMLERKADLDLVETEMMYGDRDLWNHIEWTFEQDLMLLCRRKYGE